MNPKAMDRVEEHLAGRHLDTEDFERRFGQHAAGFLKELGPVFHLLRRLAFDLRLPVDTRHFAAAAALYLAEHQDFLPEAERDAAGLIDDVWVGYNVLLRLDSLVDEEVLADHWRGQTELADVIGLAHNVSAIRDQVPSKILEKIEGFLGIS